ncbi:hypothetical protein [Streptomyces sp. NPDC058653]|uniref:hypothetical protein n=1 Tax=Streptomyces sp. NPDC058653 TaxID=3346576 RepID=UPI00364C8786
MYVPERSSSTPVADFTCCCGEKRRACGGSEIAALTAHAGAHRETCEAIEPRPCEHCGIATRLLSNGQNGYPAHKECRETWETQKPEIRRREKAAERIKKIEKQWYKSQMLREQLTRDGYAPDVIAALISGGALPDPEVEVEDDE